jgi:siderophore synthetase component
MEIIFYNKTAQMQGKNSNKENDSNHYEQEILRLEICLLTAEKIKAALGTNLWAELNDQAIASLFRKMMYEQVSKKWSKWRADRRRFLVKELIVLRKAHKNDWHHLIMQEIRNKSEKDGVPFLLDIEQVTDALKTLKDPYRNRHRAIASLNAISIQDDLYHRHDLSKVEEILSAIKPCDSPPR